MEKKMSKKQIKKMEMEANKVEFLMKDGSTAYFPVSMLPSDEMENLFSEIIARIASSELSTEQACELANMIGHCGPSDIKDARR